MTDIDLFVVVVMPVVANKKCRIIFILCAAAEVVGYVAWEDDVVEN